MSTTTPLTDSINALTAYANEVTGSTTDQTLSDAVYTLAQGFGQVATGTFTGDGTNTFSVSCDFYPDVIMVEVENIPDDVTWMGCLSDYIIRNSIAIASFCNSSSANYVRLFYYRTNFHSTPMSNYNEDSYGTREPYADVNGSTVTVTNNTDENVFGFFASGTTYKYTFIKYS